MTSNSPYQPATEFQNFISILEAARNQTVVYLQVWQKRQRKIMTVVFHFDSMPTPQTTGFLLTFARTSKPQQPRQNAHRGGAGCKRSGGISATVAIFNS
ncbi:MULTISPECIES: hypothetical protein [unclassified Duganella]|uniref:hypothetical protein n=1 Tax=unclassified Duganella TaxID=2636909 RepID=UPI0011C0E755|nr:MULTISPECIES: hypothetical protein [unclassified Duganella]